MWEIDEWLSVSHSHRHTHTHWEKFVEREREGGRERGRDRERKRRKSWVNGGRLSNSCLGINPLVFPLALIFYAQLCDLLWQENPLELPPLFIDVLKYDPIFIILPFFHSFFISYNNEQTHLFELIVLFCYILKTSIRHQTSPVNEKGGVG